MKRAAFLLSLLMLLGSFVSCFGENNASTVTTVENDVSTVDTEYMTEPPATEPPATEPPATESPATEPPATESPATEPPATEPPATEPPATEPPATEPPATEPPATEPPATEPPATEPPATEPPATEPPATEPPATEPPATEPPATEPPATEPPATEPPATEPPATEPPVTEPPVTEPPVTEPVVIDDGLVDGGAYIMKNASLVLACTTFGTIHGEAAKMSVDDGDLDSIWYFERQADGTYMIRSAVCGYYLSVKASSKADGAVVAIYNSTNNHGQHWTAVRKDGGYVLKCVDTEGFLGSALQVADESNAPVWDLRLAVSTETVLPSILPIKGAVKSAASCPEIIKYNGVYYNINMTGGMKIKSSKDLITWSNVTTVFNTKPSWIKAELGYDSIWAPGYYMVGGKLRIYYCVSSSGSRASLIGLVDCATPTSGFTDKGMVIRSYAKGTPEVTPYNCIDPNVFEDDDGKVYLVWGSYAEGIYMQRIDPETGLLHKTDTKQYRLADAPDFMEAPYLVKRGDYYYLFVAMGSLKKTADYYWAVGRSKNLTGPYVDKNGKSMLSGNTSRLTEWKDGVQGAAHAQPFLDDDGQWYMVSESWEDRSADSPQIKLHISTIVWNEAGWPVTALSADLISELAEK